MFDSFNLNGLGCQYMNTERADQIKKLLIEGKATMQVVNEIGCHFGLVQYYRKLLGLSFIKIPRRNKYSARNKTIQSLSDAGLSGSVIAKQFRLGSASVTRIINPEKSHARAVTAKLIRDGKLVRPSKCQKCGIDCKPDVHHKDYKRPNFIAWLCQKCHHAAHVQIRRMPRTAKRRKQIELI